MADLFGDDSGSEEDVDAPKPAKIAVTNGHGGVNGAAPRQNGAATLEEIESDEVNHTNSADDLPPRYGGVEYGEDIKGPRDDISVSVTGYQKSAEDFTFDVEVNRRVGGAGVLRACSFALSQCCRWK